MKGSSRGAGYRKGSRRCAEWLYVHDVAVLQYQGLPSWSLLQHVASAPLPRSLVALVAVPPSPPLPCICELERLAPLRTTRLPSSLTSPSLACPSLSTSQQAALLPCPFPPTQPLFLASSLFCTSRQPTPLPSSFPSPLTTPLTALLPCTSPHFAPLSGLKSRYEGLDIVVIRENTEGEYSGLEHEAVEGVEENLKLWQCWC